MQYARLERTGNQALADALAQAKKEGLVPSIYCHPVGYHGHAAGPPIGMTDYQQGVPVRGDYVFRPNTWHSIELNVTHNVPGVGQPAGALRARRRRRDHARRQVGLDRRPAGNVLFDQEPVDHGATGAAAPANFFGSPPIHAISVAAACEAVSGSCPRHSPRLDHDGETKAIHVSPAPATFSP